MTTLSTRLLLALLLPVVGGSHAWAQDAAGEKPAVAGLSIVEPAAVGIDGEKLGRVRPAMQRLVDEKKVAGAVVAVARRGKLVMLDAVGVKDLSTSAPMTTDTIFRIYSMTKPIASAAALTLVDDGKLKLDAPVSDYIPAFAKAEVFVAMDGDTVKTEPLRRAVTVRDLLRHSSGLTYGFYGNSPVDQMYLEADVLSDNNDLHDLSVAVAGIPLMNQPGDRFQYGVSVDVLGRVIEVVSKQPLDEFLREKIFDPLQMTDTGFFVAPESADRLSTNYKPGPNGQGLVVADGVAGSRFMSKPKMLSGGGGLISTVTDYLRFAEMIRGGGQLDGVRILRPETVRQMTSNQLADKAVPISVGGFEMSGVGFGLGVSVVVQQQQPPWTGLQGEYGWDGMASTHYWASPDKELIVVVLTQRVPFSGQLRNAIKPIVYGALVD